MADNRESSFDSAGRDISNAVKMGADTARAAKTVGKAAAQAATGNVAGAAVSLAKDPKTLSKLISIVLVVVIAFSSLTVCFLYALPTAIFEATVSYFNSIEEEWEEGVYGADGGVYLAGVMETIKTGGRIVSDFAGSVWRGLVSFFTADSGNTDASGKRVDDQSETISGDGTELHVTQEEAAERSTLNAKIEACQKKLEVRAGQIKEAVLDQKSEINGIFKSRFAGTYDVWDGTTINVVYNDISKSDAIKLLSAYTVVKGASLEGMNLSDFLRWLGYYREFTGAHTKFNLGGDASGVTASVKTWCGTFMPQYLQEQMEQDIETEAMALAQQGRSDELESAAKQIEASYEKYQGPAADLLFVVNCPDFASVQPLYEYVETDDDEVIVHCSVTISVTITTRSIDTLSDDILGFWDKDLDGSFGPDDLTDDEVFDPAA